MRPLPQSGQESGDEDKILSDGESTPNSVGLWVVIGIVLSILATISNHRNHERSGVVVSLLAFFGIMVLIILAVAKVADSLGSQRAFDRPGGEQPRQSRGAPAGDTQDSEKHPHPDH